MKLVAEKVTSYPEQRSHCPCGCGATNLDMPRSRVRLLEHTSPELIGETVIELAGSVDGGRTWRTDTWIPTLNPLAARYLEILDIGG